MTLYAKGAQQNKCVSRLNTEKKLSIHQRSSGLSTWNTPWAVCKEHVYTVFQEDFNLQEDNCTSNKYY